MELMRNLKQIVNVEFIEPEWTTMLVFDFSFDTELVRRISLDPNAKNLLSGQLQELDYETFSAILNTGGLFLFFCIYMSQIMILGILLAFTFFIKKRLPAVHKKSKKHLKDLKL